MSKKTLHLNLMKKWFNLIAKGEKKEEYRDVKESILRLLIDKTKISIEEAMLFLQSCKEETVKARLTSYNFFTTNLKDFDTITFSNGYRKDRRQLVIECKGVRVDKGRTDWGAKEGEFYLVLGLGEILSKNF